MESMSFIQMQAELVPLILESLQESQLKEQKSFSFWELMTSIIQIFLKMPSLFIWEQQAMKEPTMLT